MPSIHSYFSPLITTYSGIPPDGLSNLISKKIVSPSLTAVVFLISQDTNSINGGVLKEYSKIFVVAPFPSFKSTVYVTLTT